MRCGPIVADTIRQLKLRLAEVEATLAILERESSKSKSKRSTRGAKIDGSEFQGRKLTL
jgi:hypothetical protein